MTLPVLDRLAVRSCVLLMLVVSGMSWPGWCGDDKSLSPSDSTLTPVLAPDTSPGQTVDNVETNLLRLPQAHIESSTAGVDEAAVLPGLTDDDTATVVSLKTTSSAPLDVVYGFEGGLVTADTLIVQRPQSAAPGRIELLVSTLSGQAGFRSVRADDLHAGGGRQEFKFQPAGARWVMLRFTAAAGQDSMDITEISVSGHTGAPTSNYAFKQTPAAALEVLKGLQKLAGVDLSLTADEQLLFADAAGGRLAQWTDEDAALVVSGLASAEARAPYLAQLAEIEKAAARAVAGEDQPFARGAKLLRWLYRSGHLKNYNKEQSDIPALLDTGRYNCASSALFYLVVARHLGLDVRAIEVPDHAFDVLYDGTRHVDVETTAAEGFDPDADPRSKGWFHRLTGYIRPPTEQPELRREVGDVGLLAVIYYNRGVAEALAGRYPQSLGAYFRALSLDPEYASAVKNALATMGNWGAVLARAQDFPAATQELSVALALAPDDAHIVYNNTAVWEMWANSEIKAGRREQALAVLRSAAQAMPKGQFDKMQIWIYVSPAQDLAKRSDWQGAIAIIDPARTLFRGQQLNDLEHYEAWLYNQQGLALIAKQDWAGAQALYSIAVDRLPGSPVLENNELFVRSKIWVGQAQTGDYQGALRGAGQAGLRFPHNKAIKDAERAIWLNWSKATFDAKNWSEGIDICERGLKQFPSDVMLLYNERVGFLNRAHDFFAAQQWQQTVDVLVQAQKRFPDDKILQGDELAARLASIKEPLDRHDCAAALPLTQQALLRFPGDARLQGVLSYCHSRAGSP